jgi:hypothetical protein
MVDAGGSRVEAAFGRPTGHSANLACLDSMGKGQSAELGIQRGRGVDSVDHRTTFPRGALNIIRLAEMKPGADDCLAGHAKAAPILSSQ